MTYRITALPPLHDPCGATASDRRLAVPGAPTHVCSLTAAPILASAGPDAGQVSALLYGEPVTAAERRGDYRAVTHIWDGYRGWVPGAALAPADTPPTHRVTAPETLLYDQATFKARARLILPAGALLSCSERHEPAGRFLPLAGGGYVPAAHVRRLDATPLDPVAVALGALGKPYLWGGRGGPGYDCSGLVQVALALAGLRVHRDSDLMLASFAQRAEGEPPQRGDIAGFRGHIGLMVDAQTLVHANQYAGAVTADLIAEVIPRANAAGDRFLGYYHLPAALPG